MTAWPRSASIRSFVFGIACAAGLAVPLTAWAGGIEQPDHGASALGRGAAFTARADDGMASVYNVAGYAQQSGTHAMASLNLVSRTYEFSRAGNYPDDPNNKLTPWGGRPFPTVKGQGGSLPLPTLSLSSDFGLERWAFFAALIVPSAAGGGNFPLGIEGGVPNPARYTATTQKGLVALPTVGVAARALDWLDIGVGAHLVVGSADTYSVSSFDSSTKTCPNQEFEPCDAVSHVTVSGKSFAASVGALARLTRNVSVGVNVRSGFTLAMEGDVTPNPPKTLSAAAETVPIQVGLSFPWILRTGARYAAYDGDREKFDVEVDFVYEPWGSVAKMRAFIPHASFFDNVDASVDNGYSDCFSVRFGGSYHVTDPLTVRAGLFHETASVPDSKTRPGGAGGFAKTGLTVGAGIAFGNVTLNASYAAILSPTREVTDGELRPSNAARGGASVDASDGNGKLYDAVNNGTHKTMAHVLSVGIEVAFGSAPKRQPASTDGPWPPPARPGDEDEEAKREKAKDAVKAAAAERTAEKLLAAAPKKVEPEPAKPGPATLDAPLTPDDAAAPAPPSKPKPKTKPKGKPKAKPKKTAPKAT